MLVVERESLCALNLSTEGTHLHLASHEALRSVIISQHLLGTTEVAVYHHTDCGMLTFHDHELRDKLRAGIPETHRDAFGPPIDDFAFLPFSDLSKRNIVHHSSVSA